MRGGHFAQFAAECVAVNARISVIGSQATLLHIVEGDAKYKNSNKKKIKNLNNITRKDATSLITECSRGAHDVAQNKLGASLAAQPMRS